jgi:plasmid stabilization system protein ParE
MSKRLRVWDEAAEEGRVAFEWYAAREAIVAADFQRELERVIKEIEDHPNRWPEYLHGSRVVQLRRFPYLVVYYEGASEIHVVAIAHGHQRPGYWKRRAP